MTGGATELRVGIFVTAALMVAGGIIFVVGNGSAFLAPSTEYHALFDSVDGLRGGSPVRMAGLDVGTVTDVRFLEDGQVWVGIGIQRDYTQYVREGSDLSIGSKGLLGDQLINIRVGQGELLDPAEPIPVRDESLLTTFLGDTGRDAEGIVSHLEVTTGTLAEPQVQEDVQAIIHNVATLSALAAENDGTVRRLLTDAELAEELTETLRNLRTTSSELARATRGVSAIVGEVQHGDGTAHEVIYGESGSQLLVNLADSAGQVALLLRDARSGDGNMHSLLYGDEGGALIENLNAMSGDLRAVAHDVREGRGTLGGLLVDPSIYEDVKRLVGNLERNQILRSLVRYSIREDGQAGPAPAPVAEGGGSGSAGSR